MSPSNDTFVLDANVFISANNMYYAPDLCAEFWRRLADCNEKGTVLSIDKVYEELRRHQDELYAWSYRNRSMFVSTRNEQTERVYADMAEWVKRERRAEALEEFSGAADGWLAAHASVTGSTLVTHEQPAPSSRNHVKLPDICEEFDVPYTNTFDMLRRLEIRLCHA